MKEQMFKAEMLNQQLEQIEEQLGRLQQQHQDMHRMIEDLHAFQHVEAGKDILVPLAPGVFVPAQSVARHDLYVNVGKETVVRKTPEELQEHIQGQIASLEEFEQELRKEFDKRLQELSALKEGME